MNVFRLSWRFLWARPLQTSLNVLMLALGLAALGLIVWAQQHVSHALTRDSAGIDVVVGAKGSPMQLILSGVYHLDAPTGNIPWVEVQTLAQHPSVAQWVPLSLGDNHAGFRIVGTRPDYLDWYAARMAQGRVWQAPMEAVLGASVAQATGLKVGDRFVGQHGLGAGGHAHDDAPYRVVGVLAAGAGVLDRLVLTDMASVWQVHEAGIALDEDDRLALAQDRETTLMLIRYRSPLAALTFPREINSHTALQAAAPALELSRLLRLLGVGVEVLQGLSITLLGVAGLSVFMGLWQAVRERQADLALLRLLGASPWRLGCLLLLESCWLALLALVLGAGLCVALMQTLAWLLPPDAQGWWLAGAASWPLALGIVPVVALGVAVLAAVLPVWAAYRSDVAPLLN
jgi:putative ABC transport system permease protein